MAVSKYAAKPFQSKIVELQAVNKISVMPPLKATVGVSEHKDFLNKS